MDVESAQEWSHWCFVGFAPMEARAMAELSREQAQSLLQMVGAPASIGTGVPLDPRHLINAEGTTAWLVMFLMARVNDLDGLRAVAEGRAMLLVPGEALRGAFPSHVNWPAEVLARYRLEPRGLHPFVLPFVLHRSAPSPQPLERSLQAPDGALEIWSVVEFDDADPERLLAEIQRLAEHVDA
jgi:hypothetical protein